MRVGIALFLGLIAAALVVAYFLIFAEWSWKKVITRIVVICAVITPLMLINNYRLFVIAVLAAIVFEIKNLLQK